MARQIDDDDDDDDDCFISSEDDVVVVPLMARPKIRMTHCHNRFIWGNKELRYQSPALRSRLPSKRFTDSWEIKFDVIMKFVSSYYYTGLLPALLLRRRSHAFSINGIVKAGTARSFTTNSAVEATNGGEQTGIWYEDSLIPARAPRRRPCIVAGNWKLNPATLSEASNLLKLIAANFVNHRIAITGPDDTPEVVVFPPFPFLSIALTELDGSGVKVGAQNIGLQSSGDYTGEVSASMVRSMGCEYVLLGQSERRSLFKESDEQINKKIHLCLEQPNLNVVFCIGETEAESGNNLFSSAIDIQIKKGLLGVSASAMDRIVIAYEPSKAGSPSQANKAHQAIRKSLADKFGDDVATRCRIQYGGNVSPDNAMDMLSMDEINGALVGGAASLNADSFTRIVDGGTPMPTMASHSRPIELTAHECVSTKNVLGESPVWSARDQCLYWVSAPEEEVWRWDLKTPPYRRLLGTMLGCVVLKEGPRGSIVLGGENAILEMEMTATTTDFAAGATILCDRPDFESTTRPNDGRVDRQGRFVFGMYNNYHRAGSSEGENNAGLFRLGANLQYEKILDYGFRVSNCICFPADGKTIYFCDTPTRKVYAFDYPTNEGGQLSNRRLVWTVPPNLPGGPDGAQVDSDGFLWIALSGAGRVVRVNPSLGVVDMVVHLPVKSPTSCTFGGPNLDELFITTRGPDGGGLYRVKMPYGIRGLPEPEFSLRASTHTVGAPSSYGYSGRQQESHGTYH